MKEQDDPMMMLRSVLTTALHDPQCHHVKMNLTMGDGTMKKVTLWKVDGEWLWDDIEQE